jgi:23S rRNA pseudouridine1911/1915/1917 synthase
MQSLGHPVVGDTLYGAPRLIPPAVRNTGVERPTREDSLALERNFLHAAHLEFAHPQSGKTVAVDAPLPPELEELMAQLRTERVS